MPVLFYTMLSVKNIGGFCYAGQNNQTTLRREHMLDEHGQDLLDELLNLRTSMDSITDVNDFIDGFRLGARLMLEAIYDDAEEA